MSDQTNTIMFVGAHHDDNELIAGTMARHREAGWRIVSVVMTNGRYTAARVSDENIERRNNESRDAAKLLGAQTVFLGFAEAGFRNTPESCDSLVQTMRDHQPRIIVTHPPLDYHFDHMQTSRCVLDASYLYSVGSAVLYYCDAWFVPFQPDVYVDVGEYVELKKRALACHKSQLPAGPEDEGSMVAMDMVRCRYRGIEAGCRYAEAFRRDNKLQNVRKATLLE